MSRLPTAPPSERPPGRPPTCLLRPLHLQLSAPSDVYSLGVTLLEVLLSGVPCIQQLPDRLLALAEACVAADPARRPSAAEVQRGVWEVVQQVEGGAPCWPQGQQQEQQGQLRQALWRLLQGGGGLGRVWGQVLRGVWGGEPQRALWGALRGEAVECGQLDALLQLLSSMQQCEAAALCQLQQQQLGAWAVRGQQLQQAVRWLQWQQQLWEAQVMSSGGVVSPLDVAMLQLQHRELLGGLQQQQQGHRQLGLALLQEQQQQLGALLVQ